MSIPLGGLRAVALRALTQTCAVRRYTETNTPDGVEQGWADIQTGCPCLVAPRAATAAENVGEAAGRGVSEWVVWLPYGTDVRRVDRLVIDPPDGRTFESTRIGIRTNEVMREVLAVLVT